MTKKMVDNFLTTTLEVVFNTQKDEEEKKDSQNQITKKLQDDSLRVCKSEYRRTTRLRKIVIFYSKKRYHYKVDERL